MRTSQLRGSAQKWWPSPPLQPVAGARCRSESPNRARAGVGSGPGTSSPRTHSPAPAPRGRRSREGGKAEGLSWRSADTKGGRAGFSAGSGVPLPSISQRLPPRPCCSKTARGSLRSLKAARGVHLASDAVTQGRHGIQWLRCDKMNKCIAL